MILFASGRTDVPAFYAPWLVNRVHAGFVDVRNPYYSRHVTRYRLSPDMVDCFVFCTKNPAPMLPFLDNFKDFGVYFFVTITPYGTDIEPNVPEKSAVMGAFAELSARLGRHRVCWRYDPIFVSVDYPVSAHLRAFRTMAERLRGTTDRCIISFIDLYEKTRRNFPDVQEVSAADQRFLAQALARIGAETGISLETCAEEADLSTFGVARGACVSRAVVEAATGVRLLPTLSKQTLRAQCACLPTSDIASYNCCPHLCRYCYANYDAHLVAKNYARHDHESSFIIGGALPDDIVHEAKQESWRDRQLLLL